MRHQVVEVDHAIGFLLSEPVFHVSGKKLLAKGHQLSVEDARLLVSAGHLEVGVTLLDDDEVPEDAAALQVAKEAVCGALQISVGAGGRVNVLASENCSVFVEEGPLLGLNRSTLITAATLPHFSFAFAGQRVGTITSAPFAVPRDRFEQVLEHVRNAGPMIQGRPIRTPSIGVLYCDPRNADRARVLFEGIMANRLERFGARAAYALSCIEEEGSVARHLSHLLRMKPDVVLVASTTAPAGPSDTVGRAMAQLGAAVECFLAPVEPGNLLLLGYIGATALVTAPGCFRSPKPNVIDLVLPPLLAGHRLTADEISVFGHGGLMA